MKAEGVTMMAEKSHKWVYVTIIVVIVALMLAGVVMIRDVRQGREAREKAKEFTTKLHDAGLPAPTVAEAARLYGVDGGPFAGEPDADLLQAEYAWWHGTAGPAGRSLIMDPDFLEAATIFVAVYQPDRLAEFQEFVSGLELDETTD